MTLYKIILGELTLLRTNDEERFNKMLEALEPIKDALTIYRPCDDYFDIWGK